MASELQPVDIRSMPPEFTRLVDEVYTSGKRLRLVRDNEEVAVLMPPSRAGRRPRSKKYSAADRAAFLASAGGWKDVDTDRLIADIYEGRRSSRPPVDR